METITYNDKEEREEEEEEIIVDVTLEEVDPDGHLSPEWRLRQQRMDSARSVGAHPLASAVRAHRSTPGSGTDTPQRGPRAYKSRSPSYFVDRKGFRPDNDASPGAAAA